eukprot:1159656-Pelagomonas_calceolata.AAC.13
MGGMGFVHYNNTIEEQAQHVLRVKRHRPGFDIKPIVMPPTATIMQMDLLRVHSLTLCVAHTSPCPAHAPLLPHTSPCCRTRVLVAAHKPLMPHTRPCCRTEALAAAHASLLPYTSPCCRTRVLVAAHKPLPLEFVKCKGRDALAHRGTPLLPPPHLLLLRMPTPSPASSSPTPERYTGSSWGW